ncbi:hypothetical protein [Streptomyces aurantiogriseus]|uniref:Uncharacterized protein n=1 Tax=Streptomyces aurantiogriseus TaxID=66870 RepID=A0A918F5U5_9ACTN|nr:hypothetical protein [Streptomyces aurantiogriseus]GGR07503.1 hypothetical protein GCM10010251_24290 [Streptomyces aurantiogriseus]
MLTDVVLRRVPGPRWVRHLVCTGLVGVVWAAVCSAWWGWSFSTTAPLFAELGVLPVLGVAYERGRPRTAGRVGVSWGRAAGATVGLFVLAVTGGLLATVTGLIEEYDPPKLSAEQLSGVWRDEEGAVLELLPGGRAELTRMPAQPGAEASAGFEVCDGTGTWSLDPDGEYHDRADVLVRLDTGRGTGSGCGDETAWTVAGTDRAPELFAILGPDLDAGELRVLKQRS